MTSPNASPAETKEYRTLAYQIALVEYVVLTDDRAPNIRLVHVFKDRVTPADWFAFEKELDTRMVDVESNAVEFEMNSLQATVDLYDRKIEQVQIWTKNGAKWESSGREFPLEKVPLLDKQKAINGLTRVEPERTAEDAPPTDIDSFLAFYSEPAIRLEAIQNDRRVTGLIHTFRNPTTNDTRNYNTIAMQMRTLRGTRRPTATFPPNLDKFANLYDRMILRISGYTIDGVEVDSANQSTAIAELHPYHKKAALQALFKGGSLKQGE